MSRPANHCAWPRPRPPPLRVASARYIMGHVLIAQGRYVDAERVSVATAEQVAPTGQATTARRMPRDSALPLVSRSRHLADVAHTQLRLGRIQAAESALFTMERAAPEWTAHHPLPRVLVGELLTRRQPSSRLRELAQRLHVTPGTTTLTHHDE